MPCGAAHRRWPKRLWPSVGGRGAKTVTEHSVFVYTSCVNETRLSLERVATFLVGAPATALAFSPGAQYGGEDGVQRIEYVTFD